MLSASYHVNIGASERQGQEVPTKLKSDANVCVQLA